MSKPADFKLREGEHGATAFLSGDWTAQSLDDAGRRLADVLVGSKAVNLDLNGVRRCDTAGAYAIVRACEGRTSAGKLVGEMTHQALRESSHGMAAK